jgi:hypothetical protein
MTHDAGFRIQGWGFPNYHVNVAIQLVASFCEPWTAVHALMQIITHISLDEHRRKGKYQFTLLLKLTVAAGELQRLTEESLLGK